MKSTGMIRKVDELGRVVIPIELRRLLEINEQDSIEIYVEHNKIILQKYVPHLTCQITGEQTNNNLSLIDDKITLSPDGAKKLIEEIERKFNF